MKTFCYEPYSVEEIKHYVSNLTPVENADFKLEKGKEHAGWVYIYFKNNDIIFSVCLSLAVGDLTELVEFFENLIDLQDEMALILDDEMISEALLYASPVDNEKIRFLIADGHEIHTKWNNDLLGDRDPELSDYEIKCDVILNKKKLLKEFYSAIKNIINTCEHYEGDIYNINYNAWKDNLRNIIKFVV